MSRRGGDAIGIAVFVLLALAISLISGVTGDKNDFLHFMLGAGAMGCMNVAIRALGRLHAPTPTQGDGG